ncbi:hypothetical protein KAM380_057860 [Aeromonas caviae]|nr:hypothetical protein KAM380_057860 [Aeromonas caviae]
MLRMGREAAPEFQRQRMDSRGRYASHSQHKAAPTRAMRGLQETNLYHLAEREWM